MPSREYTPFDRLLIHMDKAVRTIFGDPPVTERPNPAHAQPETELGAAERRQVAGADARQSRRRSSGAGALSGPGPDGQACPRSAASMERAALEENDHLAWCEQRLKELDSHTSLLNPLWYGGSFAIGAAGRAGGRQVEPGFRGGNGAPGGEAPGANISNGCRTAITRAAPSSSRWRKTRPVTPPPPCDAGGAEPARHRSSG